MKAPSVCAGSLEIYLVTLEYKDIIAFASKEVGHTSADDTAANDDDIGRRRVKCRAGPCRSRKWRYDEPMTTPFGLFSCESGSGHGLGRWPWREEPEWIRSLVRALGA
jgi:hypothetical protein